MIGLTRVLETRHGRQAPLLRTSAVWSGFSSCLGLLLGMRPDEEDFGLEPWLDW